MYTQILKTATMLIVFLMAAVFVAVVITATIGPTHAGPMQSETVPVVITVTVSVPGSKLPQKSRTINVTMDKSVFTDGGVSPDNAAMILVERLGSAKSVHNAR